MKKKIINILLATMIAVLPVSAFAAEQQGASNAANSTQQASTNNGDTQKQELSNKDKVVALLKSIETGATEPIGYINPNQYTQHNLSAEDGLAGFGKLLSALPANSAKVNIVRAFQDGDYVVAQTEYNFFGPKAGFDIFRFEDGKIVEHWDNLQEIAGPNPSGHTMFNGVTQITDLDKTEYNKELIKNFAQDVLMGKSPGNMAGYFDGDKYIQHNPGIVDGVSGLSAALKAMADKGIQMKYDKIQMVLGQGNLVLVASEGSYAGKPTTFYDLFRVENNKIAEHWDVIENTLSKDQWKNNNGKFSKDDFDKTEINSVIHKYEKSINLDDTNYASKFWLTTKDTSFIDPRAEQYGWDEVKNSFYDTTMGKTFSKRDLKAYNTRIQVFGDYAVAEFKWNFHATFAKDNTPVFTQGRETQVYGKFNGVWKIVHVHYSGPGVTGDKQGF